LKNLKSSGDSTLVNKIDSLAKKEKQVTVAASSDLAKSDSIFQMKGKTALAKADTTTVSSDTNVVVKQGEIAGKKKRTTPLTEAEKELIDSVVTNRGYLSNAYTMALNNSRNLKNTFDIKRAQVDNHQREYRRYQIAWYQKYTQAIACFVMFLIGAPLGAIIKKGGLGLPVLISIIFFILFYMLTITGEKWAKEGITDPLFGTIFSNLCLVPFGLFFLRQARKDARLFEPDYYTELWKKVSAIWPKRRLTSQ
jgi:lipopolysaccharide export LptBFGC system permease protein LptF